MDEEAQRLLVESVESMECSARGWDMLRRVSRTIADLDDRICIEGRDVVEAVGYRLINWTR